MASALAQNATIVSNGDDRKQTYWAMKEAVASLSPIVRNRLHGIPAYILDYADLIIANHVEKPFLKPVLVTGPCTDEKWDLLQTLADEFPDVFAFPPVYTDEPAARPEDPLANTCALVLVNVWHARGQLKRAAVGTHACAQQVHKHGAKACMPASLREIVLPFRCQVCNHASMRRLQTSPMSTKRSFGSSVHTAACSIELPFP